MFSAQSYKLRGSRRTRPFAYGLAAVVALGLVVVLATLTVGVVRGLDGGESIELMSLEPAAAATLDPAAVAPSRPAPPLQRVSAPATLPEDLAAQSRALVAATDDGGPDLGAERPRPAASVAQRPTFDGRPLRAVKTLRMLTTAYSPDAESCGIWADGITASGYSVWTNGMKLVAADTTLLPFGTIVSIPGYNGGRPVPVLDRGGAIKGYRLDVLYPTHERALQWGAQRLDVTVWEYAD
jgi:3D (Asp-Asp-Asp) domain-containing protein